MKTVLPPIAALAAVLAGILVLSPAVEKATARKAKAVIDAPTWAAAGPVLIKGSKSVGSNWKWKASGPSVAVGDNGEDLVVAACAPGVYSAELTVTGGAKYSESVAVHTFQVGGSPPAPGPVPPQPQPGPTPVPPNPGPQPGPQPGPSPGPDNKFGLAKIAHDLAAAVNVPNRALECKKMAADLRAIAKKIDDGVLKGLLDAAQEIMAAQAKVADRAAWDSAIQGMRAGMTAVIGKFPKLPDLSQALKEIAFGLESVQ